MAESAAARSGLAASERDVLLATKLHRPVSRPDLVLQRVAAALPEASVAALAARTEGWAAGLHLAALSLRGQDDAAGFVAAFTGSHRCSPICSAPGCRPNSRTARRNCTVTRPPGASSTGWPTRRSGTRWPPGK
jgi:hypothetical protein